MINRKGLKALAPLAQQYEDGRYEMSVTEAKTVKIFRAKDGGYQRDISLKRVDAIATDLKKHKKSNYPEITVANIGGVLQCVDGQHRLLAHIQANMPIAAHVRSMTQAEAVELFVRDNGLARPLRSKDLIAGSNHPLAKSIRSIATAFKVSQTQAKEVVVGILGTSGVPLYKDITLDERQDRAIAIVLNAWTSDKRFRAVVYGEITNLQTRNHFQNSIERSFSSPATMRLLGRLAKDNIGNLNKLQTEVVLLRNANWAGNQLGSLRTLAKVGSNNAVKPLYDYFQQKVLLPAYAKMAKVDE